jgi:hypothetical protein
MPAQDMIDARKGLDSIDSGISDDYVIKSEISASYP